MFFNKKSTIKSEYDLYLQELLNLIKEKGILVEVMPKCSSFSFDVPNKVYKRDLGAVPIYDNNRNITNIYVAYEDFDGSVKYYDYPEYTQNEIEKMRKEYEHKVDESETILNEKTSIAKEVFMKYSNWQTYQSNFWFWKRSVNWI